jgi:hypothetical protein
MILQDALGGWKVIALNPVIHLSFVVTFFFLLISTEQTEKQIDVQA